MDCDVLRAKSEKLCVALYTFNVHVQRPPPGFWVLGFAGRAASVPRFVPTVPHWRQRASILAMIRSAMVIASAMQASNAGDGLQR